MNVRQYVKSFRGHWVCESTVNAVHLPFTIKVDWNAALVLFLTQTSFTEL